MSWRKIVVPACSDLLSDWRDRDIKALEKEINEWLFFIKARVIAQNVRFGKIFMICIPEYGVFKKTRHFGGGLGGPSDHVIQLPTDTIGWLPDPGCLYNGSANHVIFYFKAGGCWYIAAIYPVGLDV